MRTKGAHGAYTHASKSATAIAAKIIGALEIVEDIPVPEASNLAAALAYLAELVDGDRCKLVRRAIGCAKAALTVYTAEAFPHYHAITMQNLAMDRRAYESGGCAQEIPFDDIAPGE